MVMDALTFKLHRARQQLRQARRQSGVRGEVRVVLTLVIGAVARVVVLGADRVFDLRRGVRTHGRLRNQAELAPRSLEGDPVYYQPLRPMRWRRMQRSIPIDRSKATLLDLGSGRGRALILGAELGFGRLVGVELDERLVRDADENIRRWQARVGAGRPVQQFTQVVEDAARYPLPDGPLVITIYNAFGPATLRHVLEAVRDRSRRSPDPLFVAYINPAHEAVFAEFPELTPHSRGRRWSVYRASGFSAPDLGDVTSALDEAGEGAGDEESRAVL